MQSFSPWALEEEYGVWKIGGMFKSHQHKIKQGTYNEVIDLAEDLKQYMKY